MGEERPWRGPCCSWVWLGGGRLCQQMAPGQGQAAFPGCWPGDATPGAGQASKPLRGWLQPLAAQRDSPGVRYTAPLHTQRHTAQGPHFHSIHHHAAPPMCPGDEPPAGCAPNRNKDYMRGAVLSPRHLPTLGSGTVFSPSGLGFRGRGARPRAPQNPPRPFPHPQLTSMPSFPGFPGGPGGPGGPRGPTF